MRRRLLLPFLVFLGVGCTAAASGDGAEVPANETVDAAHPAEMMSAAEAETAVVTYSNIRFAFHVSLPGHSCAADEALVYVVPGCGTLCAFGMAVHVVKVDGVWLPAPVEGLWMS